MRLAFLCLGTMGYPMAGHLRRAGHDVTVYNRSPAVAERWRAEHGGAVASTPAAAAMEAEVVLACTADDAALGAIATGPDGAFTTMRAGAIFVDHTTASPRLARELAVEAARRGLAFLDAPISGGQSGAERGALTVMVGGDAATYAAVTPVLACYAKKHAHMGAAGTGQLTKLTNQICIAGLIQSLAEGIRFAQKSGLAIERVVEVLSAGAGQSWQMENRARTMDAGKFDFGFAVDLMRKDLAIALAEAAASGVALPVAALVDRLYAEVQAMGGGRWDTSSLIARLP